VDHKTSLFINKRNPTSFTASSHCDNLYKFLGQLHWCIQIGLIVLWYLTRDCCTHLVTPAIDRTVRFPEEKEQQRPGDRGGGSSDHNAPHPTAPQRQKQQGSLLDQISQWFANIRHSIAVGTHTPDIGAVGQRPITVEWHGGYDYDYDDGYS
jgi:hypothetical protein